MKPVFAVPSIEGARLALRDLLRRRHEVGTHRTYCAIAIDVIGADDVLVQRALAHADVPAKVRDAFRELVDRHVTRFAESQRIDPRAFAPTGDPYRGGVVASNEFAGFDCGYALSVANARLARLNATLRNAAELDIRLYAIPFLVMTLEEDRREEMVVMRREDGTYVYETAAE